MNLTFFLYTVSCHPLYKHMSASLYYLEITTMYIQNILDLRIQTLNCDLTLHRHCVAVRSYKINKVNI